MPLVTCPHCNRAGNVPESRIGQKLRCPGCKNVFISKPDIVGDPSTGGVKVDEGAAAPDWSAAAEPEATSRSTSSLIPSRISIAIDEDNTSWFQKGFRFGCGFMASQIVLAVFLITFFLVLSFLGVFAAAVSRSMGR